jgi:hypothetical protein
MGRAVDAFDVLSVVKRDVFLGIIAEMARLDAAFLMENALTKQCVDVASAERAVIVALDAFMISID